MWQKTERTVFITSFHGLISRNILSTSLFGILRERGIKIVLLVPEYKASFFKKEYERDGIAVEEINWKLSRTDLIFRYISLALLNTRTLQIKRKTEMKGSGAWLTRFIGNRKWARIFFRQASALFTPRRRFGVLIDKYQPDLIFSTDLQNELDVGLIHEARDRKVKIVGMVRSWDNLTSKGVLRVLPDRMVVWNEIVKQEAVDFADIRPERISIIGIPHYDAYVKGNRTPRSDFYASMKLDLSKRFIVFAPTGDRYIANNTIDRDIVSILQGVLPGTYQLLVRLPPGDIVNLAGLKVSGAVRIDDPGTHFGVKKAMELSFEDDRRLADTLFYCDLLVTGPSTIAIDAVVFGKPVIFVAFDGYENRKYYEGMERFLDYTHIRHIIESQGVSVARSQDEFMRLILEYLGGSSKGSAGRKRLVEIECFKLDGGSTQRLANEIISNIG